MIICSQLIIYKKTNCNKTSGCFLSGIRVNNNQHLNHGPDVFKISLIQIHLIMKRAGITEITNKHEQNHVGSSSKSPSGFIQYMKPRSMWLKIFTVILLIGFYKVNAQNTKPELGGYFENQLLVQEYNKNAMTTDYNKLRVDIHNDWNENLSFNADFILKSYHGKTEFNLLDFMPSALTESYAIQMNQEADSLKPAFGFAYQNEYFLDNVYVSFYSKHFNLRVGKQQLPWGSGYAWNPTDLFNTKNLMDPTYEKTGVNAIKAEVPFLQEGKFTAIYSPSEDFAKSTYAFQLKEHANGFDISTCYVIRNYSSYNYYTFQETLENQQMAGLDFSGSIMGVGLHGEFAVNFMEKSKNYQQYLVGADYTLSNGLFLMAEYYYNGKGESASSDYTLNSWMNMLGSYGENLGRNYLYAGQSLLVGDYLTCSNFVIVNADDKSAIVMPWFDFLFGDNVTLTTSIFIPIGDSKSEFGGYGYGGMVRLKAFF